jgi:ATP-binding cassette subfamily B (MDR/TAP) protein 1
MYKTDKFPVHFPEFLSKRLRLRIFGTILHQDISFFDEERNSTGALTSSISEQPQKVNAALGITLGVIIQNLITLIGGIIVGLCVSAKFLVDAL